jgi:transglutaminase-like putative cysteine protease
MTLNSQSGLLKMQLNVGCQISFESRELTPAILMLRPRSGAGQWIMREEYQLSPHIPLTEYTDGYGNLCQRIVIPQGAFEVQSSAVVDAADTIDVELNAPFVPIPELPDNVLQFILPSRYCEADRLGDLALEIVGEANPGYEQVEGIRRWVHENIEYAYGTSNASTSAFETVNQRVGVCRDFTHVGIALCRSLNIPARMVVGYLYQLKPMDLHAWFEAYIGDRWYTFDATQNQPKGNRVTIAYGRDAADVAMVTQFGAMDLLEMRVWVTPSGSSEIG